MRQAVFVVVLVAAAFLGGAMVNGPGIRWVQSQLLNYMGLKDGGEIASIDLPPAWSGSAEPHRLTRAPTVTEPSARIAEAETELASKANDSRKLDSTIGFKENAQASHVAGVMSQKASRAESRGSPPLPIPTAVPEPDAPRPSDSNDQSDSAGNARFGAGTAASSTIRVAHESTVGKNSRSSPPVPSAGEMLRNSQSGRPPHPAPDRSETSGPSPAPLDASVGPALLASLSPSSPVQPGTADRAKVDTIPLEVAPLSPPSGSTSSPSSTPVGSTPRPSAAIGEFKTDWTSLRHKLQSLGVTRYMIEGEPGGRVVFSCLIPLAGRQAVSQRFEAEADDEFQAAQVAIRRISLWRATRASP